ncbi:MAG: hypothetical protein COB36_11495 [Alphaproteobacteria bacterium]|nr:MAG: hypothetical protein COB36_11495 [Alphaproteobacteria bacterium]
MQLLYPYAFSTIILYLMSNGNSLFSKIILYLSITYMEKNKRYADISDRLRLIRKILDKTQPEFGKDMGISKQTYAHYESGGTCIPPVRARRLLEIYGISLDFIYAGRIDTLPHKIARALSLKSDDNTNNTSNVKGEA